MGNDALPQCEPFPVPERYEPDWLCQTCGADFRTWMRLPGEDRRELLHQRSVVNAVAPAFIQDIHSDKQTLIWHLITASLALGLLAEHHLTCGHYHSE